VAAEQSLGATGADDRARGRAPFAHGRSPLPGDPSTTAQQHAGTTRGYACFCSLFVGDLFFFCLFLHDSHECDDVAAEGGGFSARQLQVGGGSGGRVGVDCAEQGGLRCARQPESVLLLPAPRRAWLAGKLCREALPRSAGADAGGTVTACVQRHRIGRLAAGVGGVSRACTARSGAAAGAALRASQARAEIPNFGEGSVRPGTGR